MERERVQLWEVIKKTKKIIISIILILLMMPIAVSEKIDISIPGEIEDLNGGETRILEFVVTYTGSGNVECRITSEVLPNGDGINITYVPDVFAMSSNSHQTIIMIVNASMLLQPGDYTITTRVTGKTSVDSGNGYPSHRSSGGNIIIQAVDYDEKPVEDDLASDDNVAEDDINEPSDKQPTMAPNNFIYFICLGIIFFIIMLLVCIKGKRRKEKNETNKKEH